MLIRCISTGGTRCLRTLSHDVASSVSTLTGIACIRCSLAQAGKLTGDLALRTHDMSDSQPQTVAPQSDVPCTTACPAFSMATPRCAARAHSSSHISLKIVRRNDAKATHQDVLDIRGHILVVHKVSDAKVLRRGLSRRLATDDAVPGRQ